jgi:hypothetical protein
MSFNIRRGTPYSALVPPGLLRLAGVIPAYFVFPPGAGFGAEKRRDIMQEVRDFIGDPGRIRTCDLQLRRLLLYPLSYGAARPPNIYRISRRGARLIVRMGLPSVAKNPAKNPAKNSAMNARPTSSN